MEKINKDMQQQEYQDLQDKKNDSILKKVSLWQTFKFVKHLTCQKPGCGCDLVAKKNRYKVTLHCPTCKSVQSYVPKAVLASNLQIQDVNTGKFIKDVSDLTHQGDDGSTGKKGS